MKRFELSVVACLILGSCLICGAQDLLVTDIGESRQALIELDLRRIKLEAQVAALKSEKAALAEAEQVEVIPGPDSGGEVSDVVVSVIRNQLDGAHSSRLAVLEDYQSQLDQKQQTAIESWRQAKSESYRFAEFIAGVEHRFGRSLRSPPNVRHWVHDFMWICVVGLWAVLLSRFIVHHSNRLDQNRRKRERKTIHYRNNLREAASIAGMVFCLFLSGCDLGITPETPREWQEKHLAEMQERMGGNESEVQSKLHQARALQEENDAIHRRLAIEHSARFVTASNLETVKSEIQQRMQAREIELLRAFRQLRESSYTIRRVSSQGQIVWNELSTDRSLLQQQVRTAQGGMRLTRVIRVVATGLFAIVSFCPLVLVLAKRKKEFQTRSRRCPRCLAGARQKSGKPLLTDDGKPALKIVRQGEESQFGETSFVECNVCTYRFRRRHRAKSRLSFPTIGNIASGKTHWLVTVYDRIRDGDPNIPATISNCPPLGGESDFDKLVRKVLDQHNAPSPTQRGGRGVIHLPEPLVLSVHDRDPWGRKEALCEVFDFSGEVLDTSVHGTDRSIGGDEFKKRAMLMDGFIYFLDPTQVRAEGPSDSETTQQATARIQNRALDRFIQELRDLLDLEDSKPIDAPVAVCIPKIDLLLRDNPLGGDSIELIRDLPKGPRETARLSAIQERSELCEEVLTEMFCGWDPRVMLENHFGNRVMFFPLSPVGIMEKELGIRDLSKRTIRPFAVLEPLLWLLYMHGYSVLRK